MEPIWLKSYQPGVPATINPNTYPSLNELFAECFIKFKDLPAFTNMGITLSYGELEQQSRNFASYLQQELQLKKGDRVAIMLPNLLQYPVVMLGILRAGCIVVNVNPLYTVDELVHQANDAQLSTIIVLENFAHTVQAALPQIKIKNVIVAKISDVFPKSKAWLADIVIKYIKRMVPSWQIKNHILYKDIIKTNNYKFTPVSLRAEDLAYLQYTGGTTGLAKGAMLTHRNMVSNVLQASAWLCKTMVPRKEIIITALPLYHIFSLTANCLVFMNYGALNVLITNPKDGKDFVKQLCKYKFSAITGVNTLFNLLLNNPKINQVDFSALKIALGGGMAVQQVVADRWQALTKKPLLGAYGLTETSPAVCINPMDCTAFNGTVGLPVPSTEISVRDDKGNEVELGTAGELLVRGPQVMAGYWHQDEETRKVLTNDGWLHTGDMVEVNAQGYVKIVDRIKDMIIVSGFNVYPNEVEDVIAKMPGVFEVAIIGVQDATHGEIVKAFIVKRDPSITEKDVLDYCHQHLTGYKVPRLVEFRNSLPKSNVGKILRRALRDEK